MNISIKEALELRKAVQIFLKRLDPEVDVEDMMAVATVFPTYEIGKFYKSKEVFSYGVNKVSDPQLYETLIEHTSSEEWPPDVSPSLYKAIGVTEEGFPEWVQPVGASDSYNKGNVVSYKGTLYVSDVDNNVWPPDVYGWSLYVEG